MTESAIQGAAARILVVEDESIVAFDIASRLTRLGHEVVGTARSGDAGFELARMHRPDLVPLLLLGWLVIAYGVSQLLFVPVRRLVASRCETIAQYY